MDDSLCELLKILKVFNNKINLNRSYDEQEFSINLLLNFCKLLLSNNIMFTTFAVMYTLTKFYKTHGNLFFRFYFLSHAIDTFILKVKDKDIIFKQYDNKMEKILNRQNLLYNQLYKKYESNLDMFDFKLISSSIYKSKSLVSNLNTEYKFNIENLYN